MAMIYCMTLGRQFLSHVAKYVLPADHVQTYMIHQCPGISREHGCSYQDLWVMCYQKWHITFGCIM